MVTGQMERDIEVMRQPAAALCIQVSGGATMMGLHVALFLPLPDLVHFLVSPPFSFHSAFGAAFWLGGSCRG